MEENNIKNQKIKLLYWIISLLILLLVIQTSFLLKQNSQRPEHEKSKIIKTDNDSQLSLPAKRLVMRSKAQNRSIPKTAASPILNTDPFSTDPLEEFQNAISQMNRIFNRALVYGTPLIQTFSQNALHDFVPAFDLQETDKAYVLRGDLPGLQKDKINISVHGFTVTIEGLRETETKSEDPNSGFYSQERSYGSFSRSITLPGSVDESNVKAEYKDGVLTITLPKSLSTQVEQKVKIT